MRIYYIQNLLKIAFFGDRSAGRESALAGPLHAHTITCLRNSGAKYRERRDNAVLARLGRTEASPGTGNEAATVDAADKLATRTEHLCRVREAHRVSLHDPGRVLLFSENRYRREEGSSTGGLHRVPQR